MTDLRTQQRRRRETGHKRRERESDRKTVTVKRQKKGANKAATERGTYAGGSSETGVSERPEVTKRSTDED